MKSITVRNYRCFGNEPQKVDLAPLTLFVGENSSGKTSLMALMRALWDAAVDSRVPDFKEEPYDLGGFSEIVHRSETQESQSDSFEGRFEIEDPIHVSPDKKIPPVECGVIFGERWSVPVPISRRYRCGELWVTQYLSDDESDRIEIGTQRGYWKLNSKKKRIAAISGGYTKSMMDIGDFLLNVSVLLKKDQERSGVEIEFIGDSKDSSDKDLTELIESLGVNLRNLFNLYRMLDFLVARSFQGDGRRPFATAPVRSQPQRIYDLRRSSSDALGDYVPTYLAQLSQRDEQTWIILKERLESFGRSAGLFDEIRVRRLGQTDVDPFKVEVRKCDTGAEGSFRNLVDVGYGVSQVLPVALELLREDGPPKLLLQQPEVHLHPSAQAALGTLLCEVAVSDAPSYGRQLVVETHSDYIIDRVRMAVADPGQRIGPDDVSIVYFERGDAEVFLHSLTIDELGNVLDAPPGYRNFFLDELQRSVGF
ncbi:MAG: AAA family ATPase [Acidimicrobiaceae bacterium]|nr:AAA family ATPase [Acidimicrobiaceae bacterium]